MLSDAGERFKEACFCFRLRTARKKGQYSCSSVAVGGRTHGQLDWVKTLSKKDTWSVSPVVLNMFLFCLCLYIIPDLSCFLSLSIMTME